MKHILTTDEEWKSIRGKYITASEVASLVGHNDFTSAAQLKRDKLEGSSFHGNAATLLGQILEPIVVQIVNHVLKRTTEQDKFVLYEELEKGKAFFTRGCLGATPDAVNGSVLLECKTTKPAKFIKYSIFPPLNYLCQLQCQMYCTNTLDTHIEEGYLGIMSTNMTQNSSEFVAPLVLYKVKYCEALGVIFDEEAERLMNSTDPFRVTTGLKKKTEVLLMSNIEQVIW